MKIIKHLIIACLIVAASTNALVTVGSSPGFGTCDYTTIQDAIDSGDDVIRVLNNQTFSENLQINTAVTVYGGFPTCSDAASFSNISGKATINGGLNQGESVISINSNLTLNAAIKLYNLELINADDASGLHITGTSGTVLLVDSGIFNNSTDNGAGIYFDSSSNDLTLQIYDTIINGNTASLSGGGIFCDRNSPNENVSVASITIWRSIEMILNTATLSGGAIAATNGCTLTINTDAQSKIQSNNAGFGGAMAFTKHSQLILAGEVQNPIVFEQNTSISHGGAIYVNNANGIYISKAHFINNNSTNGDGGVIYVNGMDGMGGFASINRSKLTGNSANFGAVISVKDTGEPTGFIVINSMLYKNGDTNDKYLITGTGDASALTTVDIINSTVVDNNTNPSFSIINSNNANLNIENSIIHNLGFSVLNSVVSTNQMICLLVNEDTSISGQVSQMRVVTNYNAFDFIDNAANDYRLGLSSTAIDWCGIPSIGLYDIEDQRRGWDAPNIDNGFGTYDAGADESYIYDIIFENSFD